MGDESYIEVSTHLYDTVPQYPPNTRTQTLEDTILNKKTPFELPRENSARVSTTKRPKTAFEVNPIFSGFKDAYDISHRNKKPVKKQEVLQDLPKELEPTVVTVNPPKPSNFWVAQQRVNAQKLLDELNDLLKKSEEATKNIQNPLEAKVYSFESKLKLHDHILSQFTEQELSESKERGDLLTRIRDYYKNISGKIPQIKEDFEKKYKEITDQFSESESKMKVLEEQRNASLAVIDKQNKTLENLRQQMNEYKLKSTSAENQLRILANDKQAMIRSSHTNQQKLLEINAQIEEKNQQKAKLNELIDTLTKDIAIRTEELRKATLELQGIKEELNTINQQNDGYRAIIKDRQMLLERLQNTPLRDIDRSNFVDMSIQVDTVPKKEDAAKSPKHRASTIQNQNEFRQVKSDMQVVKQALTDQNNPNGQTEENTNQQEQTGVNIENSQQLHLVREKILQNNNIFDYSVKSIVSAHEGNFGLDKSCKDEAKILSRWIMTRIMKNACKTIMNENKSVQTDAIESLVQSSPNIDLVIPQVTDDSKIPVPIELKLAPKSLVPFVKKSRFCSLLTIDGSNREPKAIDWLVHTIRSIFDEKTVDDRTQVRNGEEILPLPEYMLKWALRQFGRDDLVQKGCWDVFISSHHHMQKYLEITLFTRFIDEDWTTPQLTFFLKCRTWILTRCISIPVEHIELGEYLTETYLTKDQVFEFFHHFFPLSEPELINDIAIRGCGSADNERKLSDEPFCVPMNRILELAVGEEMDSRVRRIRRMLAFFRPIPRMTLKRFGEFVKKMIVNIDPNLIDSLYRSSLVPNSLRQDYDMNLFIETFLEDKEVLPRDWPDPTITCEQFAEYSPIYSITLNRWEQFKMFLEKMLDELESRNQEEEIRILINEIRHETFQMLEAKFTFDGILFYQTYHRVLEVVLSTCYKVSKADPENINRQINDFQKILFEKHRQLSERVASSNPNSVPQSPK
ncbi:hypothetical protein TVAG_358200 [Trichomonas vaginalis G3]|uniref:Uncharacterized protein n=1 Tax=Trichomonas vaginalis (strain ATCC PRA-98 / G3) TaxID=412133 RepID=A2ELC8_TRIV3|nr:hypothetical protein TVAGG3_0274400 [Trichomonas vaginalis G3]EAY06530.1 hypothetical protein TVAG_358200 [Trichomonas vaginalis G3]KAI5526099.1 hypothetical protein TVAGG3_0274400 [Trichomonas vaginalis G3]|eukprot:XP_001318753.1 hypothetical protein [Trichomonas vaginalis G3]